MQSFERFGISNELVDLFQEEDDLIKTIGTLTQSIQLCDMNTFDDAVRKLPCLIKGGDSKPRKRLDIVKEDIYNSYRNIIDSIGNNRNVIFEEIHWCAQKGYLQQALTLIESKALREVFCDRLMYWEPFDMISDVKQIINKTTKQGSDREITQKDAVRLAKKKWENYTNYSIVLWCIQCITKPDYKNYKKYRIDFFRDVEFQSAYISLKDLKQDNIPDDYSSSDDTHDITLAWKEENKNYEGRFTLIFSKENKLLFQFLRLHMALKNQRNTINHASESDNHRYSYADIANAIEIYVKMAKELFSLNSGNNRIDEISDSMVSERHNNNPKTDACADGEKNPDTLLFKAEKKGKNKKGNLRLEGTLEDGSFGVIPYNGTDLSGYIGTSIKVRVLNNHNGGTKECEMIIS